MKLANVTSSQLEYLVAALDQDTWKQAAEANGVSPSALSQGIGELERRLGIRLFDKQGRTRVPTPEAQVAGDHAIRILAELRKLTRWAEEVRDGASGQLAIGMIDTAALHHFADELMAFRHNRPEVGLRLRVHPSGQLLEFLRAGDLDAAVCVDPDPDDRLVAVPLVTEPLYVYAPPGVVSRQPAEWGPWVSFPAGARTRAVIASALRRQGAPFEVVAESSQPAVLKEMVRLGMGWTVLAAVDAEHEPHALSRAIDEPVASRTLTLVRRNDRTPNPALAALLDAIMSGADAAS